MFPKPLASLKPNTAAKCADEVKYDVVERVVQRFTAMKEAGETVAGSPITSLVTVNGVRVGTPDGTWGLVRASSNKPNSSWWSRAGLRAAHARHVQGSRHGAAREPKSAPTTRRFERAALDASAATDIKHNSV